MNIPLEKLNYTFTKKPILVGGMAMEYYGLRKSGRDIDLIATEQDVLNLIKMYPDRVKDLYADLGVCPFEFEIWRTICFLNYDRLIENTIEEENVFVISLQNLLLMKALAMKKEKYLEDTKLIVEKMTQDIMKEHPTQQEKVKALISDINNIVYIEKRP